MLAAQMGSRISLPQRPNFRPAEDGMILRINLGRQVIAVRTFAHLSRL